MHIVYLGKQNEEVYVVSSMVLYCSLHSHIDEANREDMEESDFNVMINWEYNASNKSL